MIKYRIINYKFKELFPNTTIIFGIKIRPYTPPNLFFKFLLKSAHNLESKKAMYRLKTIICLFF